MFQVPFEEHGSGSAGTPTTRNIATTAPLAGGGDLSEDRTLTIGAASGSAAGSMSSAHYTKLEGIAAGAAALSDATPAAVGVASPGVATTASRSDHVHAPPVAASVPLVGSTATSQVTSTQQYIFFNGRHTGSYPLGSTSLASQRVFLQPGTTWRLRATADGAISSPDGTYKFRVSLWISTGSNGTFAEDTNSRIDIVNSDGNTGAGAGRTGSIYTVPSGGRWATIGVQYVGGASLSVATAFQLEQT